MPNKVMASEQTEMDISLPTKSIEMSRLDLRSLFVEVKAEVHESLSSTTMHGLPHIIRSRSLVIRLLWIAVTLAASTYCVYLIFLTFKTYLSYNVITQVEMVTQIPFEFPQITLCNSNLFLTDYSLEFVHNITGISKIFSNSTTLNNFMNIDFARYFVGLNAMNPKISDGERQRMGLNLSDMIISCAYNFEPCSADDFEWYFDVYFGNCFKFNSGKNSTGQATAQKMATKPGFVNGLTMELLVGQPKHAELFGIDAGIHLTIANRSKYPLFFDGMNVPTGSLTNVAVSKESIDKLSSPYSECFDEKQNSNSVLVQAIVKANYSYNQLDCFQLCFQQNVISQCQCRDLNGIALSDSKFPPCLTLDQVYCNFKAYKQFYSQNINEMCSAQCPSECSSSTYSSSISSTTYPNQVYYEKLKGHPVVLKYFDNNVTLVTYDTLKTHVLGLKVFYEKLGFTAMTQTPQMQVVDLISNVGGTLGLFMGLSFLSFFEIFDFAYKLLYLVFGRLN